MDESITVPELETIEAPGAFSEQRRRLPDSILIGRGRQNLDRSDVAIVHEIASHARSPSITGGGAFSLLAPPRLLCLNAGLFRRRGYGDARRRRRYNARSGHGRRDDPRRGGGRRVVRQHGRTWVKYLPLRVRRRERREAEQHG